MDRERVCFLLPVGLVFTAVDLTLRYSFVVCFVKGMNESIKNFLWKPLRTALLLLARSLGVR
jgi:hypothetical protein